MRPHRALMALALVLLAYRSGFKAGHDAGEMRGTLRTAAAMMRGTIEARFGR